MSWIFAFDSTGTKLAEGEEHVVRVMKSSNGNVLLTDDDETATVSGLAFDPSGDYLATIWSSDRVKVWRIRDGLQLNDIPVQGSWGSYPTLTFSADGKLLIAEEYSAGALSTFRAIWWKQQDTLLEVCKHVAFNLSPDEWRLQVRDGQPSKTCPNAPMPAAKR